MNEPLATVTIQGDLPDRFAYIVVMKDEDVVAGIYRCPTCKGEGYISFTERRDALVFSSDGTNTAIDAPHEYNVETPCGACGGSGLVSEKVNRRLPASNRVDPTEA